MLIRRLRFAAAALLAAPPAFALGISADGAGQAVLLPYYSLADGMSAVFSVTNHADAPKAVRVVIAEGRNGRPALTFNVYLAARDSWNGALIATDENASSAPLLLTNDDSCTTMPIGAGGVRLRDIAYSGSSNDGFGQGVLRLHSGQIEVIELGTLTGSAATLAETDDCTGLRNRFVDGVWADNANADVAAPGGRLSAELQLVDVAGGVAYGIEAFAVDGFSGQPRHGDAVNAARIYKPTATNAQGRFEVGEAIVEGTKPADAVSLLMMAAELEGAFSVEDSLDSRTRWAVSFPTRPAYTDNRPGGEFAGESRPPFHFVDAPKPDCPVETTWQTIDRTGGLGDAEELAMCAQVNRIDVLAGEGPGAEAAGFEFYTGDVASGRIRVGFHPERHSLAYTVHPGADGASAKGLPVLAVPMIEARNANAQPGVLASYAITGKVVRRREGGIDF